MTEWAAGRPATAAAPVSARHGGSPVGPRLRDSSVLRGWRGSPRRPLSLLSPIAPGPGGFLSPAGERRCLHSVPVPLPRSAGLLSLAAVAALAIGSCGAPAAAPSASLPIARVAGQAITQEQLDVRLQSALADLAGAGGPTSNPQMLTRVTSTVIGSLIFDTVVAQEAAGLHMAASPGQVQDRILQFTQDAGGSAQLQAQLAAAGQSMAGLRDEITSAINEQNVEAHFAQLRAAQVLQQLDAGTGFASLVAQYSDSPDTAAKGGQLGTLGASRVSSELGAAVLAAVRPLRAGQHTETPIRNSSGYEILQVDAVSASGWALREILVSAPQPYTVKERPQWFAEEVYYQIYQESQAHQISVYGAYAKVQGADPCAPGGVAGSPAPSGSPGPATASPISTPPASPSG